MKKKRIEEKPADKEEKRKKQKTKKNMLTKWCQNILTKR